MRKWLPSRVPAIRAGPKARAGFIAAPVSGPPTRMSKNSTAPIASPAILPKAPRGSMAVAYTTVTRKMVSTISMTKGWAVSTPAPKNVSANVPRNSAINLGVLFIDVTRCRFFGGGEHTMALRAAVEYLVHPGGNEEFALAAVSRRSPPDTGAHQRARAPQLDTD